MVNNIVTVTRSKLTHVRLTIEVSMRIITLTWLMIGGENVKQFQIELEEVAYQWLAHIAEVTGQSIENVIANGIYEQVAGLEECVNKSFADHE